MPHLAIVNSKSENSEYTNQSQENKDCYMIASAGGCEKCMYGNWYQSGCYMSLDCYNIHKAELCYECVNCARVYDCRYCQDVFDSRSCYFSIDLHGCSDCFGCAGLRNKQYCFFNEQLSKEEYQKRIKGIVWSRKFIEETRKKAYDFSLKIPRKFYHGAKNVDFSGDYIEFAKNTFESFNCKYVENISYSQDTWWSKDSLDVTEAFAQNCYETQGCVVAYSMGMRSCWDTHDSYYSDMCFGSSDLFGCMGLRQKHYCILNKQYSKEEYVHMKNRLIAHMKKTGEWGEFFPAAISPFAYNESVAQDFFPLTKEEAKKLNFQWYEREETSYTITKKPEELPQTISEASNDITKEVIACTSGYQECAKAYAIVPLELELYKKMNLPLPLKCFPCRRKERLALRNPRKLWHRKCMCEFKNHTSHQETKCPTEFQTSYSPERKETIYCETCYIAEVV